jgi:acetylornithine deacetylase/succinyl-diaminopimelate desuccinylase-like protein
VVATCGVVKVEPGFVTAVSGATEISIDLRALDAKVLAKMQKAAEKAARRRRREGHRCACHLDRCSPSSRGPSTRR